MKKFLLLALPSFVSILSFCQSPKRCPGIQAAKHFDTICGSDFGGSYMVNAVTTAPLSRYKITWSTNGTGIFDEPHALSTYYEYTPSDAGTGFVWLKVKLKDKKNVCSTKKDSIFLKLNDPARISLDPDHIGLTVCGNQPINIDGGLSGTANTVYWSSNGTGYFSPNPAPNTFYYPSFGDRLNGYVQVHGITNDPPGPCNAASDYLDVYLTGAAANAGNDTIFCASRYGGSFPVNAITNSFYEGQWSANGFGYFNDPALNSTYYNFDPSDVGSGNIQLYFTVDNYDGCGPFTDTVNVTLNEAPWLDFPNPYVSQCVDQTDVYADVYPYGYTAGGTWTSTGTGTFDEATSISTVYHASKQDIENGCLDLIFTTNDPQGPCGSVSGSMSVCFYDCGKGRIAVTKRPDPKISVALFPNPAHAMLMLQTNEIIHPKDCFISDITGKTIACYWSGTANTLDISRLAAGLYFLHIYINERTIVLKFVKE